MDVRAKSSTNEKVFWVCFPRWRGATYRTKRSGEIGDPRGVPTATSTKSRGAPWKDSLHDRPLRKDLTQATMYGETPFSRRYPVRACGWMLSNPLLISRKRVEAFSLSFWAITTSWFSDATM